MMRKFLTGLMLVAVLVSLLCLPAYALESDVETPGALSAETAVDGSNITVNVVMPPAAVDSDSLALDESVEPALSPYATYALDDLGEVPPDTMSGIVTALFGSYTPRIQTVTENLADGSSVSYQQYVPGVAGLDWVWLSGVCLFSLCLWSFFRLLGGVLRRV